MVDIRKPLSGCGSGGRALASGARGRKFKSSHSDQYDEPQIRDRICGFFLSMEDKMETLRFGRGSIEYLKEMTDAICESKLGEEYFAKREKAEACIRQGLLEDEVYVAFLPDLYKPGVAECLMMKVL